MNPESLLQLSTSAGVGSGLFWKDTKSVYQGSCEKFSALFKKQSGEEIIGLTDYDAPWPEAHRQKYLADDNFVIQTQKPILNSEEKLRQQDGKIKTVLVSKYPWVAPDRSKLLGIIGAYTDITAQKILEEILAQGGSFPTWFDRMEEEGFNPKLPPQEFTALQLYNEGLSRKQAAMQMNISETTYAWYLRQIRLKYNITNRKEMQLFEQKILLWHEK